MIESFFILYALFMIVVLFCYILFGGRSSSKKNEDKSIYDIYRSIGEKSSEYKRYQKWLRDGSSS